MAKNPNIKKVLVIGSGPIVIGQAAEFDYAGTQACSELKKEGIEVILVNSNPATIMTDKHMADHIYIEPLTVNSLQKIILKEKPDSILPNLGGQTGLNLAMDLFESGFLNKHHVRLLGTTAEGIKKAEDRLEFKKTMEKIGEPCIPSRVVHNVKDALTFVNGKIGYPVVVRPAYTLGGYGGGIAHDQKELKTIAQTGLNASRVHEILVEKCVSGWKEIEFEVIRDKVGNVVTVCNMENIDPVGVHTGDSIVVAPCQTLADKELQMLRTAALKIITELKIEGGCNVQYALNPKSFEYAVIEVNPRVSRSSALASKATGYPIARVATKIAIGYTLDEIINAVTQKTYASFEPVLDYVVVKIPKWPFAKFLTADTTLGTQMKATGEVMAIAPSLEMALMKAIRSLEESNIDGLQALKFKNLTKQQLLKQLHVTNNERMWVVSEALRKGISVEEIHNITTMDVFFIHKFKNIVNLEKELRSKSINKALLTKAKMYGFTDKSIAKLCNKTEKYIKQLRIKNHIIAQFKTVDTCGGEFKAHSDYYYSSYDEGNEVNTKKTKKKILIIGSGPIRIGQGIEFDYCSVHCVWALKKMGYETIIVNSNPETVSTDFDIADKLYFEPLTREDITNICELEKPDGAITQFGGQTAIKMTEALSKIGVKIFGTSQFDMDRAEDRKAFNEALHKCHIPQPSGGTIYTAEQAKKEANKLGYPVLVRPSYVLGGQGMAIAYDDTSLTKYVNNINNVHQEHPILIDKYMQGRECEVDAICDGTDVLIPGVMEHIDRAGIHSGDSIAVYPPHTLYQEHIETICEYTKRIALELKVIGVLNIQFIVSHDRVYIIEVNPRSSRTVPYISKVTNLPIIDVATNVIFGKKLRNMPYGTGLYKKSPWIAVKVPVFSFEKIKGSETALGPEMKSTGEVLGIDKLFSDALLKAFIGVGTRVPNKGNLLVSVRNKDKEEVLPIVNRYNELGFKILATKGTGKYLKANGVDDVTILNKIWEGNNSIINLIHQGKIDIVLNTPTIGKDANSDGFKIRRLATECKIPCFTSLDAIKALRHAIKDGKSEKNLVPVDITKI